MNDVWTMLWKESKDFLFSGGRFDLIRPLLSIAVVGIALPLSWGQDWINLAGAPVLICLIAPFSYVILIIGDAIAGERERHTLETLLASRISDRAILLSKVLVAVAFNWALTVLCLLLGAVVVNLSLGLRPWQFYQPVNFVVVLVLCVLFTLLAASGGVLISLKSATVRQASQTLLLGLIILALATSLVVRLLPSEWVASLTTSQGVLIIMLGIAILDAILLAASLVSFRRSRLILS